MEKPLAASGRHRLAGQAHESGQPRVRLVAVSRRDLHHRRDCRPIGRRGSLRHLPRLPRHLPDQGLPRALPARCAALHFLPDDRAQGADPARVSRRRSATASMAATIASRCARGTSSRSRRPRGQARRAREFTRARAGGACAARRRAIPRAVCEGSPVKRIGRDRFVRNVLIAIGNSGDASLAREAERLLADASPLVRGAAVWALGQLLPREKFAALRKPDANVTVQDEWAAALA